MDENEIYPGARIVWTGNQNPWCAPGYNGVVLKVAHHDPDSFKIRWDRAVFTIAQRQYTAPKRYTWERRANLRREDDGLAGVPALVAVK